MRLVASSPGPLSKIRAWYTLFAQASSRTPIKSGCGANRDSRALDKKGLSFMLCNSGQQKYSAFKLQGMAGLIE